jgi:hypothetical protein
MMLKEIDVTKQTFKIEGILASNRKINLTDILSLIRKIEGVTTVSLVGTAVPVSDISEKALLRLKAIIAPGQQLSEYRRFLVARMQNLEGVVNFKIKRFDRPQPKAN